jgi:hypothetical protein
MPAVQTTYADTISGLLPGMVANQEPSRRITRTTQDTAGVGFGKPAFRGTADGGFTGQTAATIGNSKFLGVTITEVTQEGDTYPKGTNAGILAEGVIAVAAAVAVTQGDPVYITPTETWTNVSNSDANLLVPNAEWESTIAAAGTALLRLK